jgi:hypothetical protein
MPAYLFNSGVLFNVAKQAANSAGAGNPARQTALIATIFSVVSMESFINEAIELASESRADMESDPGRVAAFGEMGRQIEESHGSLELKYQVAKWVFSGSPFEKAANPFQDFATLIATRNALIHFKLLDKYEITPDEGVKLTTPIPILDRLRSRGVLSDFPEHVNVSWLERIGTSAMASWSCNVAKAMVTVMAAIPPDGLFKTNMRLLLRGFEIE